MATLPKQKEGNDFCQTIAKNIKKFNKKLEKIAQHEATYIGKTMPEEVAIMIAHKPTYIDKLKTYTSVMELYNEVKPEGKKDSQTMNLITNATDTQTELTEEEETNLALVQFILACNTIKLAEEKRLLIKVEDFLSKQYLECLKK